MDVLKTNLFVARQGVSMSTIKTNAGSSTVRVNAGQMFMHILKTEGPAAFLKGWTASYARIGPQTTLTMIFSEQIRLAAGVEGL